MAGGFDEPRIAGLIEHARAGSSVALGELLTHCAEHLAGMARRAVGGPLRVKTSASDLVQETSLEAHRDFAQFRGQRLEDLLAWLRAILMHNVMSARRRQSAEMRDLAREVPLEGHLQAAGDLKDSALSPRSLLMSVEEGERVWAAIERLPEDQRAVVLLRHREQLSFAEIGSQLGRSMQAAHKLWCRALVRLQKELAQTDECP